MCLIFFMLLKSVKKLKIGLLRILLVLHIRFFMPVGLLVGFLGNNNFARKKDTKVRRLLQPGYYKNFQQNPERNLFTFQIPKF